MTHDARRIRSLDDEALRAASEELARMDPRLGRWIARIGALRYPPRASHFRTLLRAILSQQLSSKAADTVLRRVLELFPAPRYPKPEQLLELATDSLRAAGASGQKVEYLRHLARAFASGHLRGYRFARARDETVIEDLVRVKGIGRWTAEMFLIFALRRPDVFSEGDLALRAGIERLLGREGLSPGECSGHAERWRPLRSVACLYLWKIAHWEEL